MKLTNDEIDVLNAIANRSGMDCWFFLIKNKRGRIYFYDLEERCIRALKEGISELVEGMTSYKDYSMTEYEIKTFENILRKINIKSKTDVEYTNFDILYKYDKKGNMIYRKTPFGLEERLEYDRRNNLIHRIENNGYEEFFKYDRKNRLIHFKNSEFYEEWYSYIKKGEMVEVRNSSGG